jgi:hypothetical protein
MSSLRIMAVAQVRTTAPRFAAGLLMAIVASGLGLGAAACSDDASNGSSEDPVGSPEASGGPSGAGPSGAGPSGAGPSGAGPSGAGPSGGVAPAGSSTGGNAGDAGSPTADAGSPTGTTGTGTDALRGYWVWEQRVDGTAVQTGPVDKGQMKLAFGTGNNKCHYIWNETTGSDFHTECTYSLTGNLVTFSAKADPDRTAAGWSCAHPTWTSWNDRPAIQYARYKFVGDRLWIGVNSYWGGVKGGNTSCKRFPFWESEGQARTTESWIVYKPVTRQEWYTKYAISTRCQGSAAECAPWPGCGAGDKAYVD